MLLNNLDQKITDYLVKYLTQPFIVQDSSRHNMLMDTVRDMERIGDHFENIIELIEYQEVNHLYLTDDAMEDVSEMFELNY